MSKEERTEETKAIGRRIREERVRAGLSRQRFAALMSWPAKQVSRYEMGFPISEHRLAQVGRNLGVNYEFLRFGTGDRFDGAPAKSDTSGRRYGDAYENAPRMSLEDFIYTHPVLAKAMTELERDPLAKAAIALEVERFMARFREEYNIWLEQFLELLIERVMRRVLAETQSAAPSETPPARTGEKARSVAG